MTSHDAGLPPVVTREEKLCELMREARKLGASAVVVWSPRRGFTVHAEPPPPVTRWALTEKAPP